MKKDADAPFGRGFHLERVMAFEDREDFRQTDRSFQEPHRIC